MAQDRSNDAPYDPVHRYLEMIDPHDPERLRRLMSIPAVRDELGIDVEVLRLVLQAIDGSAKQLSVVMKAMSEGSGDPEYVRAALKERDSLKREHEELLRDTISEILPPRKFARMLQIAYRIQVSEVGLENALVYGKLQDELDLTPSQWRNLALKADELRKEKELRIQALSEEYDAKLLENLTPTQRKKLEGLLGDPFEYQPQDRNPALSFFQRLRKLRAQSNAAGEKEGS